MLRLSMITAFIVLSTTAFAQQIDAVKGVKYGVGCIGPVSKYAAGLGTCDIESAKARIFCPDGQVFDRAGAMPQSFVVRSICGLNQVL
jgi:hypothetical protein